MSKKEKMTSKWMTEQRARRSMDEEGKVILRVRMSEGEEMSKWIMGQEGRRSMDEIWMRKGG